MRTRPRDGSRRQSTLSGGGTGIGQERARRARSSQAEPGNRDGGRTCPRHRSLTRVAGLLVGASFVFVAPVPGTGGRRPSAGAGGRLDWTPLRRAQRQGGGQPHDHRPAARLVQLRRACSTASRPSTASRSTSSTRTAARRRRSTRSRPTRTNPGPQAPDVIDVGLSFGPQAKTDGLLQPLQGRDLGRHPGSGQGRRRRLVRRLLRRAGFEINTKVVAERPEGLGGPAQARVQGQGRPRRRPAQLQPGDLRRLGGGARQRRLARQRPARPRLLQEAQRHGQLRAGHRQAGDGRLGRDPDRPTWTYNALADRDTLAGNPADRGRRPDRRPSSRACTSRRISAYAPHPNAAKLWEEYLYSDEGQLIWLKGYCNPIRYDDLVARDVSRPTWPPSSRTRPGRVCRRSTRSPRRPTADHDRLADHGRRHGQVTDTEPAADGAWS